MSGRPFSYNNNSVPPLEVPPAVARELAGFMRSSLFAPLSSNISRLREQCETTIQTQKDIVQDAQSQISDVIEPTAEKLFPIAEELKDVYRQIELLEALVAKTGDNIRQMTSKVEKTEQALRREERALNEGKPLAMWNEPEPVKVFRAADYVESGRLKEQPVRPSSPMMSVAS